MERDLKRGKTAKLLDKDLEDAIKSYDLVKVEDLLESGVDPTLLNEEHKTVFNILLDTIIDDEGEIHLNTYQAERPLEQRWIASRIYEALLKAGAKFDPSDYDVQSLSSDMFFLAIKYSDSVEYIEDLLKHSWLSFFGAMAVLNIIKLAHRKGVDLLKDLDIGAEGDTNEGDLGPEGSLYRFMLDQKSEYKMDDSEKKLFDELIKIARQEEVRRALSGKLPVPLQEGLVTHDTLPDDIIDKISRISKGGKKKRTHRVSTKRKLIKRKKRKSLFKK